MTLKVTSTHFDAAGNISRDDGPNNLTAMMRAISDALEGRRPSAGVDQRVGGVIRGLTLSAPTPASSQAAGTGETQLRVQLDAGLGECAGARLEFPNVAAVTLQTGSFLTGFVVGTSVVGAVCIVNRDGSVGIGVALGTPATTGSEQKPTPAEIEAILQANATQPIDADDSWALVGYTTFERDGDTSIVQTYDVTDVDIAAPFGIDPPLTKQG